MLTAKEKRVIEYELVATINQNPNGINTRVLIDRVMSAVSKVIPNANRHHVAGMLSWVWKNNNCTFLVHTPGYSVVV